ncbi:MAG: pyruvate flavodoxin/ferredoxin oxidoreductase [Chloroflexi bacterium]|nr:pyruvate flavodoxin/ferredoxin oxidoreductase [Chloroflexota bacterium]
MREFLNGSEAIVRAALDAGCTFFAGYPITPASEILAEMLQGLPRVGGVAIQAEDEIAAMGFCIGAAMAGARVLTATSGPGISLYSENLGLAIMAEAPLVVVDCQRMGPATGGATTVGQGDVQFLRWGTSGGYPVIVLAPASVADCYTLTRRAFALAERFRTPVFLATDKEMATTQATVDQAAFCPVPAPPTPVLAADAPFRTFNPDRPEEVIPLAPLGGAHVTRYTTSSHDASGRLSTDPAVVGALNRHLAAKIDAHQAELEWALEDLQPGAQVLFVSYGTAARATAEAVALARARGRRASLLTLQTLWPVPQQTLRRALQGVLRVVVVELNLGQYLREVERLSEDRPVVGVLQVDGELPTPEAILEKGGLA